MMTVLWIILILVCFKVWHDSGFVLALIVFLVGLLLINTIPFLLCLIIAIYIVREM